MNPTPTHPRPLNDILEHPTPDIPLTHPDEITLIANHIFTTARRHVIGLFDNAANTSRYFPQPHPTPTRPTHRITQLIFEPSILTYPETLNTLQHSGNRHDAIRILDRVPITLLIADTDLALLDLSTYDDHTTNSLLIRNHRRILACHSLFDTFWSLALPAPSRGAPNLDPNTHRILALLASGATDTTIAEITGQSVRTIERRVHNLFTHLGATTRFQAGAQAARRGWI